MCSEIGFGIDLRTFLRAPSELRWYLQDPIHIKLIAANFRFAFQMHLGERVRENSPFTLDRKPSFTH